MLGQRRGEVAVFEGKESLVLGGGEVIVFELMHTARAHARRVFTFEVEREGQGITVDEETCGGGGGGGEGVGAPSLGVPGGGGEGGREEGGDGEVERGGGPTFR